MSKGFAPMPDPDGKQWSLDSYVGVTFMAIGIAWTLISGLYTVSLAPALGEGAGGFLAVSIVSTFLGAVVFAIGWSKQNTGQAGDWRSIVPVAGMASGIVLMLLSGKDTIRNVSIWVEKGYSGAAISEGIITLLGFLVFIAGRLMWNRNIGENPSGPGTE
jgi:hypothetical protein